MDSHRPLEGLSWLGQAAVSLAQRGYQLVPCFRQSKKPALPGGHLAPLVGVESVAEFWSEYPFSNIGIKTGDGFYVADMDSGHALKALKEAVGLATELLLSHSPGKKTNEETGEVRRSVGHAYFRSEQPIAAAKSTKVECLEFFGEGSGFVLVPPSRHPNGELYEWADPDRTLLNSDPPPFPEGLRALLVYPHEEMNLRSKPQKQVERPEARRNSTEASIRSSRSSETSGITTAIAPTGGIPEPLGQVLHSEATARALFERFALDGREFPGMESAFHCLLPTGKDERNPSAAVYRIPTTHHLVYVDFHDCADADSLEFKAGKYAPSFPLGVVYAACITGKLVRLPAGELPTWSIRMMLAFGLTEPLPFPDGFREPVLDDPDETLVWEGFKLNVQCHDLYQRGQNVPMAWRFTARWCGLPEKRGAAALKRLMNRQLLTGHKTEPGARTPWRFSFGPAAFAGGDFT
jgi:hypothetical protein